MRYLFSLVALLSLCWSGLVQASFITVSAAASFKDALDELKTSFEQKEDVDVYVNYAGSGTLALQIINGAAVDIFISADEKSIRDIQSKGALEDESIFLLCENSLVAVTLKDFQLDKQAQELAKDNDARLLTLDSIKSIAIGNTKTVPAGRYAFETLKNIGLFTELESKIIYTQNVRQALNYVLKGEVDVALVYGSDYFINKDELQQVLKLNTKSKIASFAALPKHEQQSSNQEARLKFFNYLKTPHSQEVFKKYGFKVNDVEAK